MKLAIATLVIVLVLIPGMSATASAASYSPAPGFQRNLDRALNYEKRGRVEEAKEHWAKVAEYGKVLLDDGEATAVQYMGSARAYYSLGDYAKAAATYEALLERGRQMGVPDLSLAYPWAYVYLGLSYAQLGDVAKAVAAWKLVPCTIGHVYGVIQTEIKSLEATGEE